MSVFTRITKELYRLVIHGGITKLCNNFHAGRKNILFLLRLVQVVRCAHAQHTLLNLFGRSSKKPGEMERPFLAAGKFKDHSGNTNVVVTTCQGERKTL